MSQVVVTKDLYQAKRDSTLKQERSIDTMSRLKPWISSDATRTLSIEKMLGLVFLPVLFFWIFVCTMISLGLGLAGVIFKGLGALWPNK